MAFDNVWRRPNEEISYESNLQWMGRTSNAMKNYIRTDKGLEEPISLRSMKEAVRPRKH